MLNVNISEMVSAVAKTTHGTTFVDFSYLQSSDLIAKIVLNDRDILFEGRQF